MYEIGLQLRKALTSAPANIAEACNKKRENIYIEGINRASGDIRETIHHLHMAHKKNYIEKVVYTDLLNQYNKCLQMLNLLNKSVNHGSHAVTTLQKQHPGSYHL